VGRKDCPPYSYKLLRLNFVAILSYTYRQKRQAKAPTYASRGHGCGIYKLLIFVDSKALKQAHSKLRNCFSNVAIGKNSAVRKPQS